MQAMTVRGPIDAAKLGITLPHEHLFLDLRNQFTEFEDPLQKQRSHELLTLENVAIANKNPYAIRDNLLLDDIDVAVEELKPVIAAGGQTIVECTSIGIHRDPEKLRVVAERTGLNIIAGSGYYTYDTHPPEMEVWSADEIADQIILDLTNGINGSEVRAGVIGEIGTSFPLHPNERKCLIAAAIAFRRTGVAIQVHTYPWACGGLEAVDVLVAAGADPVKIIVCHADVLLDLDYIRELLGRGVVVEFDNFGKEFVIEPDGKGFAGGSFARDTQRISVLKTLIREGYVHQLLVTNDICLKCMLRRYGGRGYDHVLRSVPTQLIQQDVEPEMVDTLMQYNPKTLYCV